MSPLWIPTTVTSALSFLLLNERPHRLTPCISLPTRCVAHGEKHQSIVSHRFQVIVGGRREPIRGGKGDCIHFSYAPTVTEPIGGEHYANPVDQLKAAITFIESRLSGQIHNTESTILSRQIPFGLFESCCSQSVSPPPFLLSINLAHAAARQLIWSKPSMPLRIALQTPPSRR